jgi:putative ABC transport system substrate-binding protein
MATPPLVGFLAPGSPGPRPNIDAFRAGLAELGCREDEDIRIEIRYARQSYELLHEAAHELVALGPRAIVGGNSHEAHAALLLTETIPIVVAASSDPVGMRLAKRLDRPGWNLTGLYAVSPALARRRFDVLGEALGGLSRVGLIWDALDPERALEVRLMREEAKAREVELAAAPVRTVFDYEEAFAAVEREGAQAVVVLGGLSAFLLRPRIMAAAASTKAPILWPARPFVSAGGLMSLGVNTNDLYRRAASFVVRILNGADPASMPMETTDQLDLAVNGAAARQAGIAVPAGAAVLDALA